MSYQQVALSKIEKITQNGEVIYQLFCRDKNLNRQQINIYNYHPYFYIPKTTPVIKHKDIVKVEKTKMKALDGTSVKKIYMKNWDNINPYDEKSYHKKYRKSYEVDIDQQNRLAIDLGIKSGFQYSNEDIDYGDDYIKPINFKVDLRRLHVDYEVSTKITHKIPLWSNPVEPMYSLANFDSYTKKFTILVQHPEYTNKTYINTTYSPPIVKAVSTLQGFYK